MRRQFRDILIGRVYFLFLQNRNNRLPGRIETDRARRQVTLDRLMQLFEMVTGHCRVHVVFCMEVHVPVKKLDDRVQNDCAGAEPIIGHIVLEAHMLRIIAKEK